MSAPLTQIERENPEYWAGLTLEKAERQILQYAQNLFDELDANAEQDEYFSNWTLAAQKEFLELMAYCRVRDRIRQAETFKAKNVRALHP